MSRELRGEKRVGKTEDQLGSPRLAEDLNRTTEIPVGHISETEMKRIKYEEEVSKSFSRAMKKATEPPIPDGIIRAYRKAIQAQYKINEMRVRPTSETWGEAIAWIEGVKRELLQLYPDLSKLPKEE